jgi:MarR-like DNA-binding transcriptional regulator SgrR of sgrS sRNA
MLAQIRSLDPGDWPADRIQAAAKERIVALAFEPLVRLDAANRIHPALAVSWRRDAAGKRWQFRLRPGVSFHDGTALTPASAANGIRIEGAAFSATADSLVMQFDQPQPDLLHSLSSARNSVVLRTSEGTLIGTGPFRITEFEPGRRAVLAAHEQYWGGRPFLDAVHLDFSRPLRDQMLDLEVGKADLIEVSPQDLRRATQRGMRTWSSPPAELLAIEAAAGRNIDPRTLEGISLAIDRGAIQSVLLQKQGEPTGAYLPQWLSGYAFLFPASRDIVQARRLLTGAPALTLSYESPDPVARLVAERIALNARDAGLAMRPVPQAENADLRLVRLPVSLADLPAASISSPERLYAAEQELIESMQLVPLVHLTVSFGLSRRVQGWWGTQAGGWRLEDVWLERRP